MRGVVKARIVGMALTLASPTTAQPGDPHWIRDAQGGCTIHNPDPHPGETVRWTGAPCPAGERAHGVGSLVWRDSGGALEDASYGVLEAGLMSGYWESCFGNGRVCYQWRTSGKVTRVERVDDTSGWTLRPDGRCTVGSYVSGPAVARYPAPGTQLASTPTTDPGNWLRDERGCWLYMARADRFDQARWNGPCAGDGYATGSGILVTFFRGDRFGNGSEGAMAGGRHVGQWDYSCVGCYVGREPYVASTGGGSAGSGGAPRESLAETLRRSAEERRRHNEEVNRQNCARQSQGASIVCNR